MEKADYEIFKRIFKYVKEKKHTEIYLHEDNQHFCIENIIFRRIWKDGDPEYRAYLGVPESEIKRMYSMGGGYFSTNEYATLRLI